MTTELENLTKKRDESSAKIKVLKERFQHYADRYETYEAGRAKQELGLEQQLWTALDGRIRQLTSSDTSRSFSGGQIFSGSSF